MKALEALKFVEAKEIFCMKNFLLILEVLLTIIDIAVFLYLYKLFKKHSRGDELVIPTKMVLPYVIAMAIISILVPAIGLCMHLM